MADTTVVITNEVTRVVLAGATGPAGETGPAGPAGADGTPGGSNGQIQWNSGGVFAGAAAFIYSTTGTHLLVTSQASGVVPLAVRAAAGQTAPLQEWRGSSGGVVASVVLTGSGAALRLAETGNPNSYADIYAEAGPTFAFSGSCRATVRFQAGSNSLYADESVTTVGGKPLSLDIAAGLTLQAGRDVVGGASVVVKGRASQTAALQEWQTSAGAVLGSIDISGAFRPASLADGAAPNGSVYYSTTAGKLVFKDSGGSVNSLY